VRFLFPPGGAFSGMPGLSGKGHRPCHSAVLNPHRPGAKAPGQRPLPPLLAGAGLCRASGNGLHTAVVPDRAGKGCAIPHPPEMAPPCPRTGRMFPSGRVGHAFSAPCRTLGKSLRVFADAALASCRNPARDPARSAAICAGCPAGATTYRKADLARRAAGRRIAAPLRFLQGDMTFPRAPAVQPVGGASARMMGRMLPATAGMSGWEKPRRQCRVPCHPLGPAKSALSFLRRSPYTRASATQGGHLQGPCWTTSRLRP
jgi:hypothetical protein